jgi:hypothetical protein
MPLGGCRGTGIQNEFEVYILVHLILKAHPRLLPVLFRALPIWELSHVAAKSRRRRHPRPLPVVHGLRLVSGRLRIPNIVGYPGAAGAAVWPEAAWPLVVAVDCCEA